MFRGIYEKGSVSSTAMPDHLRRVLHSNQFAAAVICVFLFFLVPATFQKADPGFYAFIKVGILISVVASLVLYLAMKRIDLFGALVLAYLASMMCSNMLNGGSIESAVFEHGPLAAAALLAAALMPKRKKALLVAVLLLMGSYTVLNFLVVAFLPVGSCDLYPWPGQTFLAYKNSCCRFFFPAIMASLLLDSARCKFVSARSIVLIAISAVQSVLLDSATSILALLAFTLVVLLLRMRRLRSFLNLWTYIAMYIIGFASMVLFRIQDIIAPMLGIMGRDITFTGRTRIWDRAIELIDSDHVLFGYFGAPQSLFVFPDGQVVGTAHNAILDILVWGGFIALILFASIIAVVACRLFRQRRDRTAALLSLYLGSFLFMGLTEYITCVPLFLFLGIAYGWKDEKYSYLPEGGSGSKAMPLIPCKS